MTSLEHKMLSRLLVHFPRTYVAISHFRIIGRVIERIFGSAVHRSISLGGSIRTNRVVFLLVHQLDI